MFCSNCGKKLDDHLKFCTNCGSAVTAQPNTAPAPQPVQPPVRPVETYNRAPVQAPVPTAKPKKKNPMMVILPIVLAVVVLIGAVLLCFVTGIFDSDEIKVAKAFTKSALEYADTFEQIALPKLAEEGEEIATSQSMELQIKDLPYMPELEGIGAHIALDANLPGRELGLTVTPSYGSADILDAQILFKDAELFLAVPQLTSDRVYMVNTEQLGSSLINMGAENEDLTEFGFNLFDMIDMAKNASKIDEDDVAKLKEAATELAKAIEAEKTGKEEIDVNDSVLKCDVYDVMIPEEALKDLFEAVEDMVQGMDTVDLYVDLFEAMGLPDYLIEEIRMEMDGVDIYGEAFDSIDMILDELGDIELEVYLHKGYVVSVYYEFSIMDVDFELTAQLGGGKNYVDDLRIELVVDDEAEIVLESNGDHTCPDGIFTDTTTVEITSAFSDTIEITSELTYEPAGEDENFQWTLKAEEAKVVLSGQITGSDNAIAIELNDVDIWSYGEQIVGLSLDVNIGEYHSAPISTNGAVDIMNLSEDELYAEVTLIEETATQWAVSLTESNPGLIELLDDMM